MVEVINALKDANIPSIMAIAGVLLILLAVGVEGVIKLPSDRRRTAGIVGGILLTIGLGLFLTPDRPSTTASTSIQPAILSATTLPTALPITDNIVFQEDFTAGPNGFDVGNYITEQSEVIRRVVNGRYEFASTSKQTGITTNESIVPRISVENFKLSFDATLVDDSNNFPPGGYPALRIEFRKRDNSSYLIYFTKEGCWVWLNTTNSNDLLRRPNNDSLGLEKGMTKNYMISVKGDEFSVYIDNQNVLRVNDSNLRGAGAINIGTALFDKDQAVTIDFDNIIIERN